MTEFDRELERKLQSWPELTPDPLAMKRTALRMNLRLAAMRGAQANSYEEHQFRLLLSSSGVLAVLGYLAWPLLSDFLAQNPWCESALFFVVILSLAAPMVLLPLVRAAMTDDAVLQAGGRR